MILNEDRILLLRSLSQEYCKQGYESKSDEILQNIYEFITFINDKNRDYEITNLVDDYIFNNQIVKAELLIKSIEDPYYKMYSILKLLDRWKDQKNLLFKEWYAEIFNCLDKIDDDFKKGDAQSRITEFIFKQYGLQDAINYAVNINGGGGWYRDNAIGDLAIELIKIDDIKSAIDLVVTNDIIFIKASEVYMHIFKKYVEKEDYNSALNILELIVEIDNKNECTLCLLNGYLFVNNFDGVYDYLLYQIKLKIGINDKYEKLKLVRDATEYAIEKRIIDFHLLISNVVDDFDKVIFNIAYATSILEERNSGKIDIYITKAIESIKSINSDLVKDYLKSKVVELYIKLGWFKDALEISKSFNDKTDSLKSIIRTHDEYFNSAKDWVDIELLTILEELHVHCLELDDIGDKFSTLSLLSNFALNHKQDKLCYSIQEKLKSIIYTDSEKSDVAALLAKLSTDIHKMGRFNDSFSLMEEALMTLKSALKSTEVIDSELYESSIDIVICELFNQGHWALAENTCLEISQIANRHRSWNTLAKNAYEEIGWKNALQKVNYFQRPEAKTYFLKGLADSIDLIDANKELILKGRYYYQDDIESMEKLMQQYALNELFFKNATPEKIQRFNRTLKIQWALDIKNQFTYTTCK
jgi:hypothetical protein